MAYRRIQQENIFINNGRTLATWFAYMESKAARGKPPMLRYEVRRGKLGKGQVLASVTCRMGYETQKAAHEQIAETVGGVEWMDENNIEKFEGAGYVPDPFAR